jgi:diaminohydroxyphosphoribosylaminopyrimidine deaminase / 5-amino-6-(5-phosphoribosylamino)uracil reductase
VLDSKLRLPLDSRLVASACEVPLWVFAGEWGAQDREHTLRQRGVDVHSFFSLKPVLAAVLKAMAERGITRLMVEAGPIVSAAFVNADLIDEAVLFHSPNPIGPDGIDALEGLPLAALTKSPRLVMTGSETAGADTVEHFRRKEI